MVEGNSYRQLSIKHTQMSKNMLTYFIQTSRVMAHFAQSLCTVTLQLSFSKPDDDRLERVELNRREAQPLTATICKRCKKVNSSIFHNVNRCSGL